MAGSGRKTFSPGDVLTSSDVQNYLMDQSVMVFAGTAARASAIPSPSAGMVAYSTATSLQVYNGTAWVDASTGYGSATGGTALATPPTGYAGLAFTADGTLTVTKAGLFDVLMFGGGGGGGGHLSTTNRGGGGGGAGAKIQTTIYLAATTYSLVVGAGGAGGSNGTSGFQGLSSKLGSALVILGGGLGRGDVVRSQESISFGTGGGGFGETAKVAGGTTLLDTNYGYNGGTGGNSDGGGGGGGGTSAVGANAVTSTGGAGGAGFQVNTFIGGSSLFKGAGGGGAGLTGGGAGGSSIGGAGGSTSDGGTAAANTASGGGGAHAVAAAGYVGGSGGSGIIYIRFKV